MRHSRRHARERRPLAYGHHHERFNQTIALSNGKGGDRFDFAHCCVEVTRRPAAIP